MNRRKGIASVSFTNVATMQGYAGKSAAKTNRASLPFGPMPHLSRWQMLVENANAVSTA